MTLPPESEFRQKDVRVTPRWPAVEIGITGNRDPRGRDNSVLVWLDDEDQLHILVHKANRCYKFKEMIDHGHYVEIIQA